MAKMTLRTSSLVIGSPGSRLNAASARGTSGNPCTLSTEAAARFAAFFPMIQSVYSPSGYAFGRIDVSGIHLDEAGHRATYDGREIELTPREFELLVTLMSHAGTVLGREQLLREAWDWQYVVETKTVDTHIKRLRDKLASVGLSPNVIETVRGYGYRFVKDFQNK